MAHTKGRGRYSTNRFPRKSSPAGMKARLAARIKEYVPEIPKGGSGTNHCNRPGSLNPSH